VALLARSFFLVAVVSAAIFSHAVPATELATSLVGKELHVFPGDKFYAEGESEEVPVLELVHPFEGRMPGSMRIPFSFAIDTRRLLFKHRSGDWDYFVAPEGKGRAWHGLIGNVLADGDTVGVRVNFRDDTKEWFVDNSNYNRPLRTIYHRKIRPGKDVEISDVGRQTIMLTGSRMRGLEYLGIRDNQLRIRYEEFGAEDRREEFLFPITGEVPLLIGVMGLRAEVRDIQGASARIKIIREFQGNGFADPVSK